VTLTPDHTATSTATATATATVVIPASPSNLQTGATTAQSLEVLWTDHSTNEAQFQLAAQVDGSGVWSFTAVPANPTSSGSFTLGGLQPSTHYWFYLRACNAAGCSLWSNVASGTTTAGTAPSPTASPTGTVTVSPSVTLSPSLTPTRTVTLSPSVTATPSGAVRPAAPTNLQIGAVTGNSLQLLWNDPANNEDGFQLASKPRSSVDWSFTDLPANATGTGSSVPGGLSPNTLYDFYLRACNGAGCSDWSNVASGTTSSGPSPTASQTLTATVTGTVTVSPTRTLTATPSLTASPTVTGGPSSAPAVPTNLHPGTVTSSSIQLLWNDNSTTEAAFQLTYQAQGAGGWQFKSGVADGLGPNTTSFTLSGLSAHTRYFFYLRACNSAGCSNWSNPTVADTP
jgi:titin